VARGSSKSDWISSNSGNRDRDARRSHPNDWQSHNIMIAKKKIGIELSVRFRSLASLFVVWRVPAWSSSHSRDAATTVPLIECVEVSVRLQARILVPSLPACDRKRECQDHRFQVSTLFGVYFCSLRALQRYRFSSPQCRHLIAVNWSSKSVNALPPGAVSAIAMTRPHDRLLHNQPM
jgi:hypothetical protein